MTSENWLLTIGLGMILVLLLWDRVSIYSLMERVSSLEKEIGVQGKDGHDEAQ